MAMFTDGEKSSPLGNVILADTGPLAYGGLDFKVILSASLAAKAIIEHRNAANSANLWTHVFWVTASDAVTVPVSLVIGEGERVRVRTAAALALGDCQASIQTLP